MRGDGVMLYDWEKQFLTPPEENRIVMQTHRTVQLSDDELCLRLQGEAMPETAPLECANRNKRRKASPFFQAVNAQVSILAHHRRKLPKPDAAALQQRPILFAVIMENQHFQPVNGKPHVRPFFQQ